jgi:hypothetical protein
MLSVPALALLWAIGTSIVLTGCDRQPHDHGGSQVQDDGTRVDVDRPEHPAGRHGGGVDVRVGGPEGGVQVHVHGQSRNGQKGD